MKSAAMLLELCQDVAEDVTDHQSLLYVRMLLLSL